MKTMLQVLTTAMLLFPCFPAWALGTGDIAPDFTLTDIHGVRHTLSESKGKIVVLEWTNPDCPFVKKHYESRNMPTLQKEATSEGIVWWSINSAAPGKEGDYTDAQAIAWSKTIGSAASWYTRDSEGTVGHLYGAKATPHIFVIDRQGVLVYAGAIDSIRTADKADIVKAVNYVRLALTALKTGASIDPSNTQAYGCSVNYPRQM